MTILGSMDDFTRFAIAGAIITGILVAAMSWSILTHRRRKREKLRRRGVKTYGH